MATTPHPPVEALVRRFTMLTHAEQLDAWARIREYLAAGLNHDSAIETELAERRDALDAIRRAAAILGKAAGEWPTSRRFASLRDKLGGWTVKRVQDAWGRWDFAIDALDGKPPRPTPAQRALLRTVAGRRWCYEDHLTSVRLWLATTPVNLGRRHYDAWCRMENAGAVDGQLLKPQSAAAMDGLMIPWREVLRVAKGEIRHNEATRCGKSEKPTWTKGPHDFISRADIAVMLEKSRWQTNATVARPDFPRPVALFGRAPAWLRGDVEAYCNDEPIPVRKSNELRSFYMDTRELAAVLRLSPDSVRHPAVHKPEPTGALAGAFYWLKSDVEAWLRQNPPDLRRTRSAAGARTRTQAKE